MAVKKGRVAPDIGSHGKGSVAVSDVSSSLTEGNKAYDIASTFSPDKSDQSISGGAEVFKFPLDDVSAGNFWTRLIINSWVPVIREGEPKTGTKSGLDKDGIANIWLPMPLGLTTTYNQNYSDTDNMMINRSSGAHVGVKGLQGDVGNIVNRAAGASMGAANEIGGVLSDIANVNSSGKMGMGSIHNQQMGLVYDGAQLRSHSLAWRMIPKDRAEQKAIEIICLMFKKFAAPVVKGVGGGDVNSATSNAAHKDAVKKAKAAAGQATGQGGPPSNATSILDGVGDNMRNIGRLGIPVTVNVEFWYGAARNEHLFQIKDSFITAVTVNYTPTGTWNAYEDGAPIETQLTVELKENAIITQGDIQQIGGY
jgi:hypothetical protein